MFSGVLKKREKRDSMEIVYGVAGIIIFIVAPVLIGAVGPLLVRNGLLRKLSGGRALDRNWDFVFSGGLGLILSILLVFMLQINFSVAQKRQTDLLFLGEIVAMNIYSGLIFFKIILGDERRVGRLLAGLCLANAVVLILLAVLSSVAF